MFYCFFEEDQLKFARAFDVVLIDFALEVFCYFFEVVYRLIGGLTCLEREYFSEAGVFNFLGLDSFAVSFADLGAVVVEPGSV